MPRRRIGFASGDLTGNAARLALRRQGAEPTNIKLAMWQKCNVAYPRNNGKPAAPFLHLPALTLALSQKEWENAQC